MSTRASIAYGFAVWGVATLAFCLFGQVFFRPDIGWVTAVLAVAAVPAICGLTLTGFRILHVSPRHRPAAARLFAATGMLLDALVIFWWSVVYPNMTASLAGPWVLHSMV
jgi:hypothetical protein